MLRSNDELVSSMSACSSMERGSEGDLAMKRAKTLKSVTLGVVVRCWHTLTHNGPESSSGSASLSGGFTSICLRRESPDLADFCPRCAALRKLSRSAHGPRAGRIFTQIARLAAALRVRAPLNKFCSAVAACLHFAAPTPPSLATFRREERCALMGLPNS